MFSEKEESLFFSLGANKAGQPTQTKQLKSRNKRESGRCSKRKEAILVEAIPIGSDMDLDHN